MGKLARNCIGVIGVATLYPALTFLLHFLKLEGRDALFLLLVFHVTFGMFGYFILTGTVFLRSGCVLLVIVAYGVIIEIMFPDHKHELVQVFVFTVFGLVAATAVYGAGMLETIRLRYRDKHVTSN